MLNEKISLSGRLLAKYALIPGLVAEGAHLLFNPQIQTELAVGLASAAAMFMLVPIIPVRRERIVVEENRSDQEVIVYREGSPTTYETGVTLSRALAALKNTEKGRSNRKSRLAILLGK